MFEWSEQRYYEWKDRLLRLFLAILFQCWWFNFHYSTIYLHGYVWAINQEYNYTEKYGKEGYMGEGSIMLHMLDIFPMEWRTAALTLNVLVLYVWLQKLGKPNWKIWEIFKISVAFGFLISFIRCQCEAHRILPAVHNGAYYYIGIGGPMLILSIRWGKEANENFIEKPKIS